MLYCFHKGRGYCRINFITVISALHLSKGEPMKDFLADLNSLYWWLSVVIVGILINLFSSYVRDKLNSRLSRASLWWQKRSLTKINIRNKEIERLRKNTDEQLFLVYSEIRDRIESLGFLIFGILFLFIGTSLPDSINYVYNIFRIVLMACGAISFIIGSVVSLVAHNKMLLLSDSRNDKEKTNT